MPGCIDLTDQRFGLLVVLERVENSRDGHSRWLCKCDCGNTCVVSQENLHREGMIGCGCLRGKKSAHGKSRTHIYIIWGKMKGRCNNPSNSLYKDYGGRGITLCDEWHEFMPFYDWAMANGYQDNLQIDRKDNDKGYSPDNCRWVTSKENCNNRRNNLNITYKGETKTLAQWSECLGINEVTLRSRIRCGWSIEKSFTTPVKKKKVNL